MFFNSSIGIDINSRRIHAVHLKGTFKGVNLVSESRCLLNESKSRQERQSDISDFINGFMREENFPASDLFIGISGDQAILREIEFPMAVKENLRTTLTYEIEKYIPFPAGDIYFDYQIVAEYKASEKLRLLLTAVKKEALDDYLKIAESIDQGVSGIEVASSGVVNYYFHQHPEAQGPVVIVSACGVGADVLMVKNRKLIYSKSFFDSGEAVDALMAGGQLAPLRDVFFGTEKAVRLVLYGVTEAEDVRGRLSAEFQEIISGDLYLGLQDDASIPAFGLALKGIRPVPVQMNLMPVGLRKKPNRTGVYVMAVLAGLLMLSAVLWAGSLLMNQRQMLQSLETESSRLKAEASSVEQMASENRKIKENLDYLRSLRPGNTYAIEIMKELSNIIPQTAWITDFKLNGNKLGLYGMADSASELITILEASPLFMDVAFLSAIRKSREGKEVFRIGCNIESTEKTPIPTAKHKKSASRPAKPEQK